MTNPADPHGFTEPTPVELGLMFIIIVALIYTMYALNLFDGLPCWFEKFDCRSLDGLDKAQLDNAFQSHQLTGIVLSVGGGNKTVCRNDHNGCHCCVDAPENFTGGDCL